MVLAQMELQFPRKEIVPAVKLQSQIRPLESIKIILHNIRGSNLIVDTYTCNLSN